MEPPTREFEHPEQSGFLGRYRIVEKIGDGGMGKVYKAYDKNLDRVVAIKILPDQSNEEHLKRFHLEVRVCASLQHPNIVRLYGLEKINNHDVMIMEYVDGPSLHQILKKRSFNHREICRTLYHVCEAIQYAHEQGFIHRDIKPSNILLNREGTIFVTDFGLVKTMHKDNRMQISKTGAVMGTPAYMSPEQAEPNPNNPVDRRSDIYSIGAVLYKMLTGQSPYSGSAFNILYGLANEDVKPPSSLVSDVPKEIENICLKALCKSKNLRYQSAQEMALDIKKFAESLGASKSSPVIPVPKQFSPREVTVTESIPKALSSPIPKTILSPIPSPMSPVVPTKKIKSLGVTARHKKLSQPSKFPMFYKMIIGFSVLGFALGCFLFLYISESMVFMQAEKDWNEIVHSSKSVGYRLVLTKHFLENDAYVSSPYYQQALELEKELELENEAEQQYQQITQAGELERWQQLQSFVRKYATTNLGKEAQQNMQTIEQSITQNLMKNIEFLEEILVSEEFFRLSRYPKEFFQSAILKEIASHNPQIHDLFNKLQNTEFAVLRRQNVNSTNPTNQQNITRYFYQQQLAVEEAKAAFNKYRDYIFDGRLDKIQQLYSQRFLRDLKRKPDSRIRYEQMLRSLEKSPILRTPIEGKYINQGGIDTVQIYFRGGVALMLYEDDMWKLIFPLL